MNRLVKSPSLSLQNAMKLRFRLPSTCLGQRLFATQVKQERILAIRREDINVWERRAPISPIHIRELKDKGITVLVQPSTRRAYTMAEYENAGAIIAEDLSSASLIVGVKQVPIDVLLPNKTYAFFSHTIKAQEGNMPLLDAMLDKNIRLVDYERMVDAKGQRVAAFGQFAGVGGMINILHGLGLRLLALGHHTPFMYVGATHNYKNSRQARLAIYELGEDIKAGKLPAHFGPLSFIFTGSGNVSKGAQKVFQELPHIYVEPHELKDACEKFDHRTLIATEVSREDYLEPINGGIFNAEEYRQFPERYRSVFAEKIGRHTSVFINGIYWDPRTPRLLTNDDALMLLGTKKKPNPYSGCPDLPHRLMAICDISADEGGSIEFMKECTTIEYPFQLYDVETNASQIGMAGDGVLMCSIDNLPAQLPREATDYFGKLLLPWIPEMAESDAMTPFAEQSGLSQPVRKAVICSNGKLTPDYEYIGKLRTQNEATKRASEESTLTSIKKRVLLLGAGMVSHPLVEYLTRDNTVSVTTVSSLNDEVEFIAKKYPNVHPLIVDVQHSEEKVRQLIGDHDLTISLLPYTLHPFIAKMCIAQKKNMLTASYVSPGMAELHQSAVDAGISIVQEVGLDPGIDHLLAMECIDAVKDDNGRVMSFVSFCGGLPAPENCENPLRYKFSWSPRGALMTVLNGARYLKNGKTIDIQPGDLLSQSQPLDIFNGFHLEGYPNRDSTQYIEAYKLHDIETMLRGTMRYHGYSDVVSGLMQLGLLGLEMHPKFELGRRTTWRKLVNSLLGTSNLSEHDLKIIIYDKVGQNEFVMNGIQKLGLLTDDMIETCGTPLDTLSHHLAKRLKFEEGERDLVLLRHQIGIQWPNESKEMRDISLVAYGDPKGYSAMARTVSLPAAIAAKMLLNGEIGRKGNVTPLTKDIYVPMLKRLRSENITWTTKVTKS